MVHRPCIVVGAECILHDSVMETRKGEVGVRAQRCDNFGILQYSGLEQHCPHLHILVEAVGALACIFREHICSGDFIGQALQLRAKCVEVGLILECNLFEYGIVGQCAGNTVCLQLGMHVNCRKTSLGIVCTDA